MSCYGVQPCRYKPVCPLKAVEGDVVISVFAGEVCVW